MICICAPLHYVRCTWSGAVCNVGLRENIHWVWCGVVFPDCWSKGYLIVLDMVGVVANPVDPKGFCLCPACTGPLSEPQ